MTKEKKGPDPEIAAAAHSFEAVKFSFREREHGWILVLNVHPSEVSELLRKAKPGTRYQVAMVPLTDQDEVEVFPDAERCRRAMVSCVMACKEYEFQKWMFEAKYADNINEETCAEAVRTLLDIESRSEIQNSLDIAQRWYHLWDAFERDNNRGR